MLSDSSNEVRTDSIQSLETAKPEKRLESLDLTLTGFLRDSRHHLQGILLDLEGKKWENFETNKQIADMIQGLAAKIQAAFKCPKCGEPARFACAHMGNSKSGVFTFSHNQTNHGGTTTIPRLEIVDKPMDARRLPKKSKKHL